MSVTYLGTCEGNTLREIADRVDEGTVTHVVVTYRDDKGDICYHIVGNDDLTFIIGMMARTQTQLHCVDTFETEEKP